MNVSTAVQYVVSISLFIAIPIAVQWAVAYVTSRRGVDASPAEAQRVAIRD